MRIVLLVQGFLEYTSQLANALAERHEVILLSFDGYDCLALEPNEQQRIMQRLLDHRVKWIRVPTARKRHWSSLRTITHVARVVRCIKHDVLHVQEGFDYRIYCVLRLLRMPYVLTVHEPQFHGLLIESKMLQDPLRRLEYALMLSVRRLAKCIIVHGQQMKSILISSGFEERKIHAVIPGCYTYLVSWLREPISTSPHEILLFGQLAPYKGLQILIAAEPLISREVPALRITVAGRAVDSEIYRRSIKNPERFEFINGFVPFDQAARLYARCGIVVLPYLAGSMSAVLGTALAFGKPVVATRVGSFDEVICSGVNGILVEPGDSVELARGILSLLLDPQLAASIGTRARIDAQSRLSWGRAAQKHEGIYEECRSKPDAW